MWFVFAVASLAVQAIVVRWARKTRWGGGLIGKLEKTFCGSFIFFGIVIPLVSLAVLLLCGVHPPWASAASGAVMIVNGMYVSVLVEL